VLQGHIRQNISKYGLAQARREGCHQTAPIAGIGAELLNADAGGVSESASSNPTLAINAAFLAPESESSQTHHSSSQSVNTLDGVNTLGGRQALLYSHSVDTLGGVNTLSGRQAHLSGHSVNTLGGGRPSRKLAVAIRRLESQVGGIFPGSIFLLALEVVCGTCECVV
jgi:hypothetical protein